MSSKVTIEPITFKKYNAEYYPGGLRKSPDSNTQFKLPTYGIFIVLVAFFIILKKVIYIKDKKRHGK